MKVTKNITIDLNNPRRHTVHLMESGNQREIILTLLKDGMPFDVSDGIGTATLVKGVGYIKANGVPGYYDWTSTDVAAVEAVSGSTNKWTVRLDEHATDVPGFAQIFVKFSLASGETLYSFPIVLDVIRTSGGTTDPDKPYYHSSSFLLAGAQAAKTPAMSFPVGVDEDGKLWVASSESVVCNITLDDDEYVCDVSFSDLTDAIEEHKTIECLTPEGLAFCQGFAGENYYLITFTVQSASGSSLSLVQYQYDEDGTITRKVFSAGDGLTEEVKTALLACFNGVAWDEGVDGQSLIDNLEDKLYPTTTLDYIVAAYVQDRTIYDTDSLDKIKESDDLIVTAYYSDGTHEDLADSAYTLSGTLTAGTSTITVSYGGKTTTISVTVTHNPVPATYQRVEWVGNTNRSWIQPSGKKLPTAFRIEAKTKLDGYRTNATYGNIAAAFQSGANTYGMEFAYKKEDDTVIMFMGAQSVLTPSDVNGVLTLGAVCTGTTVKAYELVNGVRNYGTEQAVSRDYTSTDYGIFYAGTSGTSYNQFVGRVYYFELYDSSDNLIAQYLPCYRKSDNVIGFYETVGGNFYTNNGGNTFTKGGDI